MRLPRKLTGAVILEGYAKTNRLTPYLKEAQTMKLHQTYALPAMLEALAVASDTPQAVAERLRVEDRHEQSFIVFDAENMLSTSPHARVTLTHRESADRWVGYMETSAYENGERIPVAVNRRMYTLVANADFSEFTIIA